MRDYNFNSNLTFKDKKRRKGNRLIVLAVLLVVGVGLATRFIDLSEGKTERPTINDQQLQLPDLGTSGLDNPAPAPQRAQPDKPVIIPAQPVKDLPLTPAVTEEKAASGTVVTATITPPDQPESDAAPVNWTEHKIKNGESLASIFSKNGLSANLLHRIVNSSKTAKELAHIRPGETLRFAFAGDQELQQLILQRNRISSLHIQKTEDSFSAEERNRDLESRMATASGIIESSLFVDGQKAGLSDAQIMELAAIFGWDIDFALEIRAGDSFSLIYEEQYLDGDKFRNGPILAAEFINRGKSYQALRFEDDAGNISYYDADGRNKRRAFIRTPVKFARISSGFTNKRWHPVLKKWRSHKGTDYAASTGTPVKATGAGKVTFRGKKGGYGNVIFLRHGGKYTTVYAHLSKFNRKVKKGSTVKQGQIIGYVGSTGLASGPHLHYEFRVNGVHRNPLSVTLPKSDPLPKDQLKKFKQETSTMLTQLDTISPKTMVAKVD